MGFRFGGVPSVLCVARLYAYTAPCLAGASSVAYRPQTMTIHDAMHHAGCCDAPCMEGGILCPRGDS